MTELYSIDVRGASANQKQAVAKKLSDIVGEHNLDTFIFRKENITQITNQFEGDNAKEVLYSTEDLDFTHHYTTFLKEESPKRIMWNDDVTLTLSALEIIQLFPASANQPTFGIKKSLYDYIKNIVNVEDFTEWDMYEYLTEGDIYYQDDNHKQELVDKVFNRDILEKEKESKKKEYEDIQSQIKELQARADKLKEEM